MAFLLVIHSRENFAQFPVRPKTKDEFAGFFNKSSQQTYYRETERPVRKSDGEVQIYAVVVGIGDYSAMPQLSYAASDAQRFYNHLKSPNGGAIPKSHIRLLIDQDATQVNVIAALKQIARKADGNDVIMFYFSGHGLDGAFLPIDFNSYSNRLDHTQIIRVLEGSKAKHKICIADACYSGAMNYTLAATAKGGNPISMQYFYDAFEHTTGGMALLMSSSAREASWEDSGLRQGVFTYYLIQGMGGRADFNRNGIINVSELFGYVHHMVVEHTGGHQSPALTGDYDDEMPVSIRE